jgi:phospholipid/cholesterol/gamma-HCH transport system ATP-binding protein
MTTVINTHDMNSVLTMGENILFIYQGDKAWEGGREAIYHSNNERLNEFVFASSVIKKP